MCESECVVLNITVDSIGQQTYIDTGDKKLKRLLLRIVIKGPTKVLEISPERDNLRDALDYCNDMVICVTISFLLMNMCVDSRADRGTYPF